ncbi:carbohydrate ABC transporter permease [Actinoplanes sp. NPDC051475]|uniref:carbohydrate ABC transporter permease n=1 Tax=Actinoplanes sp. NPDC051475 TaxID=3157225 RepID=UPI00344C2084
MVAVAPQTAVRTRRRQSRESDTPTVGRSFGGTIVANLAGLVFSLVMFFPIYWVVNTAFKPAPEILQYDPTFYPHGFTLDNFRSAFNAPFFQRDLVNGVLITVGAVIGALVVGFLAALAIARFRFYGRKAIILIVLSVQMVPLVAVLIPLFLMLQDYKLTNSLLGVTLVYIVLILPYTVWTLRGFIQGVPRELDEAAEIDGAGRFQVFWRIILPLTGPGLVATSVYGFIQAWNEFIIINTLNDQANQNLMAWLMQNQTSKGTFWGPLMAGSILTALPVVVFFLIVQRNIATGLTAGAVKG